MEAGGWLSPQSLGPHITGAVLKVNPLSFHEIVLKVKMSEAQTSPKADLLLGLIPARRE